jgi:beta-mannosidase
VKGTIRLSGAWGDDASVSVHVELAAAGSHAISLEMNATNVKLWWPNTWGAQNQYDLNVTFTPDGSTADGSVPAHGSTLAIRSSRKIGFRTVVFVNRQFSEAPAGCNCTTIPLPSCCASTDRGYTGKPRLFFRVNGLDLFARGANFVSVDALESRVTEARYRQLISSAKASHFQIFRVNGDANYFKPAFYDLCSEMGILIWQEFMFSDCDYGAAVNASERLDPSGSNPSSFLFNVRSEVQHQVRRLSHQPCIAMWISNNEILKPDDAQVGFPLSLFCDFQ